MLRILTVLAFLTGPAMADESSTVADIVDHHILPRIAAFADSAVALDRTAEADCDPKSEALRSAYQAAFDGWASASHLRFGPTETDNRAFALEFWPDSRGMVPKALKGLLTSPDPVLHDPQAFSNGSVAFRGLTALEYMLYDPEFADLGSADDRCALIRAIAADLDRTAGLIRDDWVDTQAKLLKTAGHNDSYRSPTEAVQALYKALYTGLEFTADTRLGQPLGSYDRPRPSRAEAWRSGRSLRNVILALKSLRDLAARLAVLAPDPDIAPQLDYAFRRAIETSEALDDPVFAGVENPESRFRVEALQQMVLGIRNLVRSELGPALGVDAGFNANDGD